MSFLMGQTKTHRNVSDDTAGLHDQLIQYLSSQGFGGLQPNGPIDPSLTEPYQKLFRDQNAQNFGQVKESAGNLTGSGLGQNLGIAAQRASTEQGAFLSEFIERKRQADANRWAEVLLGSMNSQAAGVTRTYQPGFLDYAIQGASAAAPFLAGPAGAAAAAGGMGAAGGGAAAMRGNPTNGQLGQASFYRFLRPNDPLYGQEGARMRPMDPFQFGHRDAFGTSELPYRRF